HAARPDARADAAGAVDSRDLDVRSAREAGVALEQRANPADLGRVSLHDRVRVADRDRDELDAFDDLRRADLARPKRRLDQAPAAPCGRYPLATTDPHLVRALAVGQPPCSDPRAVSRQLGPRP